MLRYIGVEKNIQWSGEKPGLDCLRSQFIGEQFQVLCTQPDSLLLSSSRSNLELDPIIWLLITTSKRSHVLRWRLGWLPGGKPKECFFHPYHNWSRRHAIECLQIHHCLYFFISINNSISYILNLLPIHKPRRPAD